MSQPRSRLELRILAGCVIVALIGIVIATRRWPPEEGLNTFDVRSEYRAHGTNAFPEFVRILKSDLRFEQKQEIMELLPELGCKAMPLVPYLMPYAIPKKDDNWLKNPRLWAAASSFLWTNNCPGFLEQVFAQLDHKDPGIRDFAVLLLPPFGPRAREAVPALVNMLDQGSANAAFALAAIDPDFPLLPERIVTLARSRSTDPFARVKYVEALQVLGRKAARVASDTAQLLHDNRDEAVREDFDAAFGAPKVRFPQGHVVSDIPSLSYDVDRAVIIALGRTGPAASNTLPVITPYLTNSLLSRRLIAARSVIQIQPNSAFLVPMLTNVFEERCVPAFDFIFGVGFPDPVTRLSVQNSNDFSHLLEMNSRTAAACLLGELGPPAKDALPALEGLAGLPGTSENLFASWAIARIRGLEKAFVVRLLEELDSPERAAFPEAEYVVGHFAGRLGRDGEFAVPRLERLARETFARGRKRRLPECVKRFKQAGRASRNESMPNFWHFRLTHFPETAKFLACRRWPLEKGVEMIRPAFCS